MKRGWKAELVGGSALLMVCAMSAAQAQGTPPRYNYKELLKPSTAAYCGYDFMINQSGTVAGTCSYQNGYTYVTDIARCGYANPLCALFFKKRVPVYYSWPVQWPANAAPRSLTLSGSQNKNSVVLAGLTDAGDIYATNNILVNGGTSSARFVDQTWVWKGQVSAGTLVTPPTPPVGTAFKLRQVTGAGRMLWATEPVNGYGYDVPPRLVITAPNAALQTVPDLPTLNLDWGYRATRINDQGQIVRSRYAILANTDPVQAEFSIWLQRGQGWERLPLKGSQQTFDYSADVLALSGKGSVLVRSYDEAYLWSPDSPQASRMLNITPGAVNYAALNDNDVLAGNLKLSEQGQAPVSHGMVEIAGLRYDLNQLTSGVPAGWVVSRAIAINNKGQVVVELIDPTKASTVANASKYAVLTPQ
jgi:hypothetical protein